MSRTYHHAGQKHHHNGRDLWSKRPLSGHGAFTSENKKLSRKIERKWFKREDYAELQYHLSECRDGFICNLIYDMCSDLLYSYDDDYFDFLNDEYVDEWMDEQNDAEGYQDLMLDDYDLYFDF